MARQPYSEDQNIHSMTTRQLRQYIADKATEAQTRLDTSKGESTTKAFREAADEITGRSGKVKRATSNMSKAEMREYAYALRQFNSLDTTSGFAQSIEWKENKGRYQQFVRNRIEEGSEYWKQFLTAKGNISKRGYQAYKDYIEFIKGIDDYKSQFGYRTLMQYAEASLKGGNKTDLNVINKLLSEVFEESRGKGFTQADLNDRFKLRLDEMIAKEAQKQKKPKKKAAPAVKKAKRTKSKSNIKVQKGRKYKGEGVRERLT